MFLKKRAVIEEEYARSMMKLTRTSKEAYSISEGKAGSVTWSCNIDSEGRQLIYDLPDHTSLRGSLSSELTNTSETIA